MKDIEKKRLKERQIMAQIIEIYCCGKKHSPGDGRLCDSCTQLLVYANKRTENCPYMAKKTFCSKCPAPCYSPDMRIQIKAVMRYAGPRMLFHHPIMVFRHGNLFG